jgi:hypothetical protein
MPSFPNPPSCLGGCDMGHVNHGVLEAVAIEHLTAGARHQGTWFLRRHPLAAFPHGIFTLVPVPRFAVGFKIRLRSVRQKYPPRSSEAAGA